MRGTCLIVALAIALVISSLDRAFAIPRVVVSVKPLHSLVAGVMAGVGEPDLIIRGTGSPHTYSLRPSEARALAGARVIFWIGAPLEFFMEKPLIALGSKAHIVGMMQAPGIALLPGRASGAWEAEKSHDRGAKVHETGDGHGGAGRHGPETRDSHLWLDPANARAMVRVVADVLGQEDPKNRGRYTANAAALLARIDALDAELKSTLAAVRDAPFFVFHDAYQYFEKSFALRALGSITVSPERAPGAKRVKEIRERLRGSGARCIFSEPQFPPGIIDTITEGTHVRPGVLDPLGADLPAGPDAYFMLMRSLGSSLAACLSGR